MLIITTKRGGAVRGGQPARVCGHAPARPPPRDSVYSEIVMEAGNILSEIPSTKYSGR